MREGSGMVEFSRKFPDRYFDVAIAEQHAVTFAAGLAIGGYKPIVAIYPPSCNAPMIRCCMTWRFKSFRSCSPSTVRALLVLTVKPTVALLISYLRCIPEMVIMTPSDENECRQMLYTGYHYNDGPSAVRYPRGNAVGVELTPLENCQLAKAL